MKIAVFGSAFNPPTLGHYDAIQYALEQDSDIGEVLLVPSYKHAFAKQMSDYSARVEMLEAFANDVNDARIKVRAVEHIIASPDKPVFTWDLLNYLETELANSNQLCFIIGPDNAANWDKFYMADEIKKRWDLIVVPERKAIRSTMVREGLSNGVDISHLLTPSVHDYLMQHSIYG